MKIATYNIWDSDARMPARFRQITEEIMKTSADIICLQEVGDVEKCNSFSASCGYAYSHWQARTGLSILSRHPMEKITDFAFGTSAQIALEGKSLLIVNVHLPWESILLREKAIVDIVQNAAGKDAEYTLLMGDFNSSEDSSVHRFLLNQQSLFGKDAYFFDLAEAFAEMTETKPLDTLNFRKNPRWGVAEPKNTIEANQRFDWILLKNPYPAELPVLKNCVVFGTEASEETCLAPSDHYGVMVEIEIEV